MQEILKTTFIGLFFGTFGTTIGGIIGICINKTSNKFLSFVLSFASGLMLSIICFDLLPEAMEISSIFNITFGIITGIITMIYCDVLVQKYFSEKRKIKMFENREKLKKIIKTKHNSKDKLKKIDSEYSKRQQQKARINKNSLLKTGIIVSIGLALHNFPEGLAIGSGFGVSITLGCSLAVAICLHDIPEGISMAVPMKNGGMRKSRVLFYVIMSGITTGIGAFFGAILGGISQSTIAFCLSFAVGAMLYIVAGELVPESNKLYSGKTTAIGNIIGFILGFIAMQFA